MNTARNPSAIGRLQHHGRSSSSDRSHIDVVERSNYFFIDAIMDTTINKIIITLTGKRKTANKDSSHHHDYPGARVQ